MSDRLPGSSWSNPIWYRKYRIYLGEYNHYVFVHDDYDGAPDANDNRCGFEKTIEECKTAIDEKEDDK